MPQRPESKSETLKVTQITDHLPPDAPRKPGRPRKAQLPPMPAFELSDLERQWYEYFINSIRSENPDLTPADEALLPLIGAEYIKYLRMCQKELADGELVTMSRQHPGTALRGLLDQLSVTRKARLTRGKPEKDDDDKSDRLLTALAR